MAVVFLAIGSNIGDKKENFNQAIDKIGVRVGRIISLSAFYETAPWGFESENSFLNAVLQVETDLEIEPLLDITQIIEKEVGRLQKTTHGYADRVIDIDILFYDDLVLKTERLIVPHALLHQRQFVLDPLVEIAPDLIHPDLNKTIHQLRLECIGNDKNN